MKRERAVAAVAVLAVAALHAAAALAHVFAGQTEEAMMLLLARAARSGSYGIPGPLGQPVTELPGWPALLVPVEALLGTSWDAYRWLGLLLTLLAAFAGWRLARRVLEPAPAALVAAVFAFSPALLALGGALSPDAPFAALAFLLLASFPDKKGKTGFWTAGMALAAFMRPHGVLLVAACAAALGRRDGWKKAAAFAAPALLPAGLWLLRNAVLTGQATAYATNWSTAAAAGGLVAHVPAVLAVLLGHGVLGLDGLPWAFQAVAGAALLGLAVQGFWSKRRDPLVQAMAAFLGSSLALHLSWQADAPRYGLPLAVPLLCLAALGRGRAFAVALGLCLLPALRAGLARASAASWPPPPPALARLTAWARTSTPPDARIESVACSAVRLLGERDTLCSFAARPRELWISVLVEKGVDYVHEPAGFAADGFFPPSLAASMSERGLWLERSGYFEPAFRDAADGRVFKLKPLDRPAFLKAVEDFKAAPPLAASDPARAKALLEEALRLEPRFANAWAVRALLEKEPAKAVVFMRKAAAADPGSIDVAEELARLEAEAARR